MKGGTVAAGLLAVSLALSSRAALAGGDEMPSDPKAFVEWVKAGHLPPIAPWKRYEGKIDVPAFGQEPAWDVGNPVSAGKEAWNTPVDGGTLVVQYNSAPKNINKSIQNDAIVEYVCELTNPYLIHQDRVRFSYGKPSPEDPKHVFLSADPHDVATMWVKEDTLLRVAKDARGAEVVTPVAYGAVEDAGDSWKVTPIAKVEGEERKAGTYPKQPGDRVLQQTFCTVYLRPGVKWHDGAPFRAQDIAFSVKAIQNENVESDDIKTYAEMARSCEALNDTTVRWILDRQYFAVDDSIVGANLTWLPEHAYRAAWAASKEGKDKPFDPTSQAFAQFFNNYTPLNEKPLGTGPYRVVEFNASRSVILERNPDYFGPRGHADKVVWKFISDPVPALQSLKSGELDFVAHGPTEDQFVTVMAEPEFTAKFQPIKWFTPSFAFIAYNRRTPQLADPRVRAALTLLADRPGYREKKFHNLSVLVSGDECVYGLAYDQAVKPLAYDPAAAEELLDEAGWYDRDGDGIRDKDGKKLEVEFMISTGSKTMKEFTPIWIESCKKAGVVIKPAEMEWAAFIERFLAKKFDAITLQWAMDIENDPGQLWHSKFASEEKKGSNPTSYADPRADALIDAIKTCLDREERIRYHHALHRLLDADQGYCYMFARPEMGAYARKWRGVRLYPRRPGFDLREWYVPKELQGAEK
jgi:ABC-type transport system substrate-binding protein